MNNFIQKREAITSLIINAVEEMVELLENDRFYPSIREAGTAPCESSLDNCKNVIVSLLPEINIQIEDEKLDYFLSKLCFDDVVSKIDMANHGLFDELEEIDRFINDNVERKYCYQNYVYRHKKENLL